MTEFVHNCLQAAMLTTGMVWDVAWSLVLGFVLSGLLQALVNQDRMKSVLGREGLKEVAIATVFGAASSSCSYASAAISRTLFKGGAGFIPSLAFLFASTNLVIELGLILFVLMGWQFTAAEWAGGLLLVALMSAIVAATYPRKLVDAARAHRDPTGGHNHASGQSERGSMLTKISSRSTWVRVAQNVAMDTSMLWKDLLIGFVASGILGAFVPKAWWATLFLHGHPAWVQVPANAVIGPLVAVVTFVCSIGNVPLAVVLWGSGISFGGVIAFLYADLVVLPLLDVYRRYYGWRTAAYMAAVFFVTMVITAIIVHVVFQILGWIPASPSSAHQSESGTFRLNYTFWLNLIAVAGSLWLWRLSRSHPMHHHHEQHDGHQTGHTGQS